MFTELGLVPVDQLLFLFFLFQRIALKFEGIISRVGDVPETTAQLVELTNFIIESRDVTMFDLKTQLQYSAKLILFLMTYAHLPGKSIWLQEISRNSFKL